MTIERWAQLLVLLAAVGWVSTFILVWNSRREGNAALTERAISGFILSAVSSLFAVMSLAFLLDVRLDGGAFTAILVTIALLCNAPQIVWALSLVTGRFR